MELRAEVLEVDNALEAIEIFFQRRWTDGLPIVPPTIEKVEEMLAYVGRDPQEKLGEIPPRYGVASIEKLAINSVMAGCLPEYFPVVIAAIQAMLEPKFNLNGVQTTQHCNEPLLIVNGPLVKRLGINCRDGVFGSGYRANGTIGRATKLILWNLGGNFPGEVDKSVFAHPGKWSYCIAEDEEGSPWEPLHVERGFPRETSTVTVFSCEAPHAITTNGTAIQMLTSICSSMATLGNNNLLALGETLLAIAGRSVAQFAQEGWSKNDLRNYVWEHARVPLGLIKQARPAIQGRWPRWVDRSRDDSLVPLTEKPEDIHIVVAGGMGWRSACCPGWGSHGGLAVTKAIGEPPGQGR